MRILGISCFYHDSAACLVDRGVIVAAAQEERFSRKKNDDAFPNQAIQYCLSEGDLSINDVDLIVFYDSPFLKFERLLDTYLSFAPRGLTSFLTALPIWLKEKFWVQQVIRKELGYDGAIVFSEHHQSHAASAFYPSPYREAAFLTMDGVGEWATASFGTGNGNELAMHSKIDFPHSLGLLYSAFTYYTGFKVNSGEYKVMGLAPYGEPKYTDLIYDHLIDVKDDGSFRMNMAYFNYAAGLTMTNERFHILFGGPPRTPESEITQKEMDIAASIQAVTEDIMLKAARHVHAVTGKRYLCLAGGVALNCVANGRILREGPFDNIWIQPAAGDAGAALGAALWGWHAYCGNPRSADDTNDSQHGSYLGPQYSDAYIRDYLEENNIPYTRVESDTLLYGTTAELIATGNVVGWFQGRMEFGPRALGARSILGDARNTEMQQKMNLKIKFRESFRPFAPSVLAEYADTYFDLAHASPYMLLTAYIKNDKHRVVPENEERLWGIDKLNTVRSSIPAVTHIDYSARVQTVHSGKSPRYHQLLSAFFEKTGCPVIVNTSFNVRGEPIVCNPEDAYRCFMRTNMDYLVISNYILDKTKQPNYKESYAWQNEYALD